MRIIIFRYILLVVPLLIIACKKSDYLDIKPDQALIVPKTIKDFQVILDNNIIMNGVEGYLGVTPSLGEMGADDYYIQNWLSLPFTPNLKELYKWGDNFYGDVIPFVEWQTPYQSVFYANLVLDGLNKIVPNKTEIEFYNNVKGSALFYRAHIFFQLAQIFSPHYNEANSDSEYGIPLRITADINERLTRSKLSETYKLIISDLSMAKDLLPDNPKDGFKTRPSKGAVFALLARVYLIIGNFEKSLLFSGESLKINNKLLDYNTLNKDLYNTMPTYLGHNDEVLFHSTMLNSPSFFLLGMPGSSKVDSNLIKDYREYDLRKELFIRTDGTFKGSYSGTDVLFSGLATDEVLLINSECNARLGDVKEAMAGLNSLLIKRWNKDHIYEPLFANNGEEAINIILRERRKELLFRGLRWSDLRRLNYEGKNISIKRILDGKEYTLPANDKHYTFLIPPDIISFNPTWPQNPR